MISKQFPNDFLLFSLSLLNILQIQTNLTGNTNCKTRTNPDHVVEAGQEASDDGPV